MLVTDVTFHWSKVEVKEEAFLNIEFMPMTELSLAEKVRAKGEKNGRVNRTRIRKKKNRNKGEVKERQKNKSQ